MLERFHLLADFFGDVRIAVAAVNNRDSGKTIQVFFTVLDSSIFGLDFSSLFSAVSSFTNTAIKKMQRLQIKIPITLLNLQKKK